MLEIEDNDFIRKPAIVAPRCEEQLHEALTFIEENSPTQAEIMQRRFFKVLRLLEIMPGIGTIYKDGMRKMLLGKFPYYIYYREQSDFIEIIGIWHTSRGEDFEDV